MAACRGRGLRVDRPRWTRGRPPRPVRGQSFAAFGLVRQWVASATWSRPGQGGVAGLHPRPRQAATPPAYGASTSGATLDRGGPNGAAPPVQCSRRKRSAQVPRCIVLLSPQFVVVSGTSPVDAAGRSVPREPLAAAAAMATGGRNFGRAALARLRRARCTLQARRLPTQCAAVPPRPALLWNRDPPTGWGCRAVAPCSRECR